MEATGKRIPSGHSHNKMAKFRRWLPLYLMFLPGAIYLIINNYIPMAGIVVAFKTYKAKLGLFASPWAGLKNFEFLFATQDAWIITRNTILYNLAFIVLNTVVGIILAIFICDTISKRAKKVYQSAVLFPYLMSAVILGYIVYAFFSQSTGIVNKALLSEPINWYSEPKYWPWILIFTNLWKGVGYGVMIYVSTINGIDPSLYEAAEIDHASKLQQIWYVTLPHLKPVIITLTLMQRVVRVNTVKNLEVRFVRRNETIPFINAYFEKLGVKVIDVDFHIESKEKGKGKEKVYTNLYTLDMPSRIAYKDIVNDLSEYVNIEGIRTRSPS